MGVYSQLAERVVQGVKPTFTIEVSKKSEELFKPRRYKVRRGGRGGTKSWDFARILIAFAHTGKERIGCFRELQNSIKDSVHRLLVDQIDMLKLTRFFKVTERSIVSTVTGSEFLFKGLRHNANEIKSTEGLTKVWVEEAQLVTQDSWELLIPTVRGPGSEIWVSFNPVEETDATYRMFPLNGEPNQRPNSDVQVTNWRDNPWFPPELEMERAYMQKTDIEAYYHVWEGQCRTISEAVIFKGKYVIDTFEAPEGVQFFQGLDFGFSTDPVAFVRCFKTGEWPNEELWILDALFGYGVEIDEIPGMIRMGVKNATVWPIKADSSRPESISYIRRQGIQITAAEKWDGSVEDGIAHLKAFARIHIHQRCKNMQDEARLYKYKVDKVSKQILPIIVDAHNHGWDAIRYALDGYIKKRGADKVWGRLGK
jgi:phage terminase large subunit